MQTSESIGYWVQILQTVAIILSIVVTGFYARKAILSNGQSAKEMMRHNQDMTRQRATIDLLLHENQDQELIAAKQIVIALPDEASFIKYLEPSLCADEQSKREKASIAILLNRYEFVALGIKTGAFEEQIYKSLKYSDTIDIWNKAKPMVMELRRQKGRDTYYQEFEWLADKWKKEPLQTN
jgi:hypothetical protein